MQAYQQLEEIQRKISHLQHIQNITSWDEAVMMPSGGGESRAKALATLKGVIHGFATQPQIKDLIERAKQENLDDWQQANLKLIEKSYHNLTCLPSSLVQKIAQASIRSEQAWRKLRAENNWQDFMPYLAENVALVRESAQIRSELLNKNPYDILIDDYSPDLSQAIIDPVFAELQQILPSLFQEIIVKQKNEKLIPFTAKFPIDKQRQLGLTLMEALSFNFEQGRLDVSHHPFCGGNPRDVRITTRYDETDFITSVMGVCHETGHALYELGLPELWLEQPVGHALGIAIHESQSLLTEMQACRTQEFMNYLSQEVNACFGKSSAYSPENLYLHYTRVKPGPIRVDADEATYPLHVILRYEIEKQLIYIKYPVTT